MPSGLGFIHPTSGGGGGGERVLWLAIAAIMHEDIVRGVKRQYLLYTKRYPASSPGCNDDGAHLLELAKQQFGLALPLPLQFVFLSDTAVSWTEARRYPRLTLLLQSVCGALALFFDVAVRNRVAPVVVESVGFPFIYPLLSVCGVRTAAYVHYPVISSDMIRRIHQREASFNNNAAIANNRFLSLAKLWYYRAFALCYRTVGWFPAVVMTNSSWTDDHIRRLWQRQTFILYPPCGIKDLKCTTVSSLREPWIVSIGQFRPEKNHALQIRAFAAALPKLPAGVKLILMGGARNREDLERVRALQQLASDVGASHAVEFRVSRSFSELREVVSRSLIGLHAMTDEHFGIVVVEYLAAGCIALAHNSGGVKLDIVKPGLGWLAATQQEFTDAMTRIFSIRESDSKILDRMQDAALAHAATFADELFAQRLTDRLSTLLY